MNRRGVTLIELLITVIIGSIAMLALAVPFSAERIFWLRGDTQAEAQRDAQLALRAIARVARQSTCYEIAGTNQVTLYAGPRVTGACTGGINGCFRGGPTFGFQFQSYPGACGASPTILLDGTRSQVTALSITRPSAGSDRLVQFQLGVTNSRGTRQSSEQLATEIFLRNAT